MNRTQFSIAQCGCADSAADGVGRSVTNRLPSIYLGSPSQYGEASVLQEEA